MNMMNIDMIIGVITFAIITFICSKNDRTVKEIRYRILFTAVVYCIGMLCVGAIMK